MSISYYLWVLFLFSSLIHPIHIHAIILLTYNPTFTWTWHFASTNKTITLIYGLLHPWDDSLELFWSIPWREYTRSLYLVYVSSMLCICKWGRRPWQDTLVLGITLKVHGVILCEVHSQCYIFHNVSLLVFLYNLLSIWFPKHISFLPAPTYFDAHRFDLLARAWTQNGIKT